MIRDKARRPAQGTSRRQVLAGGAAALSLVGLSGYVRAASRRVDVAIVGGGLAGLYAGMLLTELGANIVVLEARDRPGGRVLTADGWLANPDLGGSQIGASYARMLRVCEQLGIELGAGAHVNAPYSPVIDGQLIPPGRWASSDLNRTVGAEREVLPHALAYHYLGFQRSPLRSLDAWMQPEAAEHDVSIAQWLDRQGASPEAKRIIHATTGSALESRGVLRVLQETSRGRFEFEALETDLTQKQDAYEIVSRISQHVVGGTSRLTDAMAATLGDRLRLGHPVSAIEQDRRGCKVRLGDGSAIEADFAIAAVPFSVLRSIDFKPGLEGVQAEAVRTMPYNNQTQVWLEVKHPYWEDDGLDASMWTDGPFSLIRQQIESDGSRVLISALAAGERSRPIDAMSPQERGEFAIAEIERIRPSTRGKLAFVGAHSWDQEQYSRGCSYAFQPGRVVEWANRMDAPHGRVHFAGEHLRRFELGMEAAMETGERAALAIAERIAG